MAWEGILQCIPGLSAAADLSSYQYCPVKMSGSATVARATSETDVVVGVLQNKPASGEAATVASFGVTKARVGSTVAVGARVTPNSSSEVITSTTATNVCVGIVLEALTVAATPTETELATILLTPGAFCANAS